MAPVADIFADWAATNVAMQLAASQAKSATGTTGQADPQFTVTLAQSREYGAIGTSTALPNADLTVDIR